MQPIFESISQIKTKEPANIFSDGEPKTHTLPRFIIVSLIKPFKDLFV
jgi:hypothetical protein